MSEKLLLEVQNLEKHFPIKRGFFQKTVGQVKAVDGVSFTLNRGETLGVVGESGCGKTTVGRCLLRLIEPTAGKVILHAENRQVDLVTLSQSELRQYRPKMQMVFQDPQSSLNSRMTVGDIIAEPLVVNNICKGKELNDKIATLLEAVGLRTNDTRRYPHAFSGGQRQRIGIARALALRPDLIVADEPVSALDVSVQAQILNLLADLKAQFQLSYIFVAHDLGVVEHISDRVAVMYLGKIVEIADAAELYSNPRHPYTKALLSAVPIPDPARRKERMILKGDVPSPIRPPSGCHFHPRCPHATERCRTERPQFRQIAPDHWSACYLNDAR